VPSKRARRVPGDADERVSFDPMAFPTADESMPASGTTATEDLRDGATAMLGDAKPVTSEVAGSAEAAPPPRRRRWLKVTLISLLVLLLLAAGGTFVGWRYMRSVESKVSRVDAFAEVVESERPAKPAEAAKAMNILILGSDSRDPDIQGSRTDTIMVAHVTADHSGIQTVSIPRDTWVDIPKSADGRHGGTKAKINAAFAWGGVALMLRTVESFTKVRIDHAIVVDFAGFAQIVNALGGIDVNIEKGFTSIHPPYRTFSAGTQHLNGLEALDYSRQRKQFNHGDFSRIAHQQQVIKAILAKATSAGILSDPGKLNGFLTATASAITADKNFDLLTTATQLRGVNSSHIRFLTNPSKGTGMEGNQSVVYANTAVCASLYAALNVDAAAGWKAPK
jgi:LCP family protein required for cell wall assembly